MHDRAGRGIGVVALAVVAVMTATQGASATPRGRTEPLSRGTIGSPGGGDQYCLGPPGSFRHTGSE